MAIHFENGARKYADRNWELGQPLSQYYNSAQRHLWAINEGDNSEDHAAAVIWNIVCYMDTLRRIEDGSLPKSLRDFPVDSQKVKPKSATGLTSPQCISKVRETVPEQIGEKIRKSDERNTEKKKLVAHEISESLRKVIEAHHAGVDIQHFIDKEVQ